MTSINEAVESLPKVYQSLDFFNDLGQSNQQTEKETQNTLSVQDLQNTDSSPIYTVKN